MTYSAADYPPFAVTVDLAVLTIREGALRVLLVERGEEPFRGRLALPGGFVRPDESAEAAAARELAEETGVEMFPGHVEQLATYSAPERDPRMRVVSVAFVAFAPDLPDPVAGTDAAAASWVAIGELGGGAGGGGAGGGGAGAGAGGPVGAGGALAFDHDVILADAVERVRSKLEYTTLAARFVAEPFSIRDLQTVYELVWGVTWDRANFRRKVLATPGFVEPVEGVAESTGRRGRRAQLYRAGPATALHPPILR